MPNKKYALLLATGRPLTGDAQEWRKVFAHRDPHFLIARTYAVDSEVEWHYPEGGPEEWYGETAEGVMYRLEVVE